MDVIVQDDTSKVIKPSKGILEALKYIYEAKIPSPLFSKAADKRSNKPWMPINTWARLLDENNYNVDFIKGEYRAAYYLAVCDAKSWLVKYGMCEEDQFEDLLAQKMREVYETETGLLTRREWEASKKKRKRERTAQKSSARRLRLAEQVPNGPHRAALDDVLKGTVAKSGIQKTKKERSKARLCKAMKVALRRGQKVIKEEASEVGMDMEIEHEALEGQGEELTGLALRLKDLDLKET